MRRYPPRPAPNPAGHWSPNRQRNIQAKFRRAVLNQAGHQCQYTEHGQRCPATTRLEAHHTEPGNNNPDKGITLCRNCHKAIDAHAR